MKFCFGLGLLAVLLNIIDLLVVDIPYVTGNSTSLVSGIITILCVVFIKQRT